MKNNLLKKLKQKLKQKKECFNLEVLQSDLKNAQKKLNYFQIDDEKLNKKIVECEKIIEKLKLLPKKSKEYKNLFYRDGLLKSFSIDMQILMYDITRIQNQQRILNEAKQLENNGDLYEGLLKAMEFASLCTPEELEKLTQKDEEKL